MKSNIALTLLIAPLLGACGTGLNPYDRSKYKESDQPISEHTNKAMAQDYAEAQAADERWGEKKDDGGWGAGTEY